MMPKSYYLTLGVSSTESTRGIREAFRDLAKRYHPDHMGPARVNFFQEIVEAYHVLADPERRSQYDRGLYHAGITAAAPPASTFVGIGDQANLPLATAVLRSLSAENPAFQAALARVSAHLTAAQVTTEKTPEGLNALVILSPGEAAQGGVVYLAVPSCSPCERCGGSGREELFPCARCDGEGLLEQEEMVRIPIPPRVGDGTLMEVPLRGLGIHNFYLRLHIRVALENPRAGLR
jgi:molecular chaperone DnaJ